MKSMADAVADTRRMVYGSMAEQINLLAQPYALDDTRLVLELDTAPIQQGMVLSCGLNEWWVKEADHASKTVYVVPRWNNSYSVPMPLGEIVMIRPRATDWQLFNEVNRAIVSMSSRTKGLCSLRVAPMLPVDSFGEWGTFTFSDPGAASIAAVRVKEPWGGSGGWRNLQDRDWRWDAGRSHLRILNRDWGWVRDVEVVYRARFRPATSLSDLLTDVCGLSETMLDIPPLGAAANLLLTTEGRRGQVAAQGDPRRAEEVVQGHNSSAAREMRRRFDDRCDDEYAVLLNQNPIRMSI